MQIRLTQHVMEGSALKVAMRPGRDPIPFVKGSVIEMSETSGQKYIEKGLGEDVQEQSCSSDS